MLDWTPRKVHATTTRLLNETADHPRMILSSGCDIPQDVPMANVEALMEAGREWQRDRAPTEATAKS
jgi:uroporphyrinogen decarboxylase